MNPLKQWPSHTRLGPDHKNVPTDNRHFVEQMGLVLMSNGVKPYVNNHWLSSNSELHCKYLWQGYNHAIFNCSDSCMADYHRLYNLQCSLQDLWWHYNIKWDPTYICSSYNQYIISVPYSAVQWVLRWNWKVAWNL